MIFFHKVNLFIQEITVANADLSLEKSPKERKIIKKCQIN
jgi:hypothetical protein